MLCVLWLPLTGDGADLKGIRVHSPGYQVTDMDGPGVCGVAETPVVICRFRRGM